MKKIRLLTIFLITILSLSSCASMNRGISETVSQSMPMMAPAAEAPMAFEKEMAVEEAGYSGSGNVAYDSAAALERIVIKNASLAIIVDDPAKNVEDIIRITTKYGGFVVNSNVYKRTMANDVEVTQASMMVRVLSDQLDAAMEEIKGLVNNPETDINSENISGEDVTSQYTDLQSRLRNLEDAAEKLREILSKATKTEDVLAVYRELTNVNEQIEVLKGQIKYYDEAAKLSSISIELISKDSIQPLTIGKWEPKGVARDAVQALINAAKFFVNLVIWTGLFAIPVVLLFVAPILLIIWIIRSRKKKKAAKEQNPELQK